MKYRVGDKVWVFGYPGGRLADDERARWWRGVVIALPGCEPVFPHAYGVEIEGLTPSRDQYGWLCVAKFMRPRDDGDERSTWSNCVWQPQKAFA